MPAYKYRVLDHCKESTYNVISCSDSDDAGWIAQDAAEDYHSNHDGWESSWPLVFQILTFDKKEIGRYSVDRDVQPVFYASKLKKEER